MRMGFREFGVGREGCRLMSQGRKELGRLVDT